jgi:hypothetical protein
VTELAEYRQPTYNGTPVVYEQSDPTGGRLVAWANSLSAAHQLASALCATSFVPKHFAGKPIEAAAALILGDELGFSPVSALRSIFVISGTPGLYAKAMVALVQSHGHEIWTETDTPTKVVVCGQRKGSTHVERSEWTTERARRAKYTSNAKYESDPQAMLYARAASILCRQMAPETLKGLTTLEELADEVEPGAPAPRGTRTVQRAAVPQILEQAAAVTAPAREFIQSASEVGRRAAQPVAPSGPPLPGEDDEPPRQQERQLEPVTDGQLRALGAMFSDLGVKGAGERADRLAVTADIVGRPISSAKDLTRDEASTVLDTLKANGPDVLAKVLGRGPAKDQPATVDEPTAGDALAVPGDDEVVVEDPPGGEDYDPTTDDSWGQQR